MAFTENMSFDVTLSVFTPSYEKSGCVLTSLLTKSSWQTARLVETESGTEPTTMLLLTFVVPISTLANVAAVGAEKTARNVVAKEVALIHLWTS
jgi:hypothetical protein